MHRIAARLALALLAFGAVACSGGPDPRERLSAAVQALEESGSAAYEMEMDVHAAGDTVGPAMSLSGEGGFDHRRGVARLRVEVGGPGLSVEMIRDTSAAYVRMPALFTGGRDRWVRQPATSGAAMTADAHERLARLLDRHEGDIRALGTEERDGRRLDGFGLTVPASRLSSDSGSRSGGMPPGMEELRELEIPVQVWLDDEDRLRKIVIRLALEPVLDAAREASDPQTRGRIGTLSAMLGASPGDTMVVTVRLSDFGTEVDPSLPEGADVMGMDEFREQMGLGAGTPDRAPAGSGSGG